MLAYKIGDENVISVHGWTDVRSKILFSTFPFNFKCHQALVPIFTLFITKPKKKRFRPSQSGNQENAPHHLAADLQPDMGVSQPKRPRQSQGTEGSDDNRMEVDQDEFRPNEGTQDEMNQDHDNISCVITHCLLYWTPPVGIWKLEHRPIEDSILARTEAGAKYKLGKGNVSKGNVQAAYGLLDREYPEVTSNFP